MSITLVPLDNDHEQDTPTVIVGKNILLKIKTRQSLSETNDSLREIIGTENLLKETELWEWIRRLQLLTNEIEEYITSSIQFRDYISKLKIEDKEKLYQATFRDFKEKITQKTKEIADIESILNIRLARDTSWNFCGNCDACIGPHEDTLPTNCTVCESEVDKKPTAGFTIRFLEKEIKNYLDGTWLEDYIARIFKKMDWEAWSNGDIMGATGVYHQMDVLAINKLNGKVVIVECKRTAKSEHAYRLITQFLDIQPSCGLLVSIRKVQSDPAINLLTKKPGLKLIEIEGRSDTEVQEMIKDYVERDN
ncbi:MAG TPA: hypothetical protein VJH55_03320 [Candidatus Paceibacterota bacterium]